MPTTPAAMLQILWSNSKVTRRIQALQMVSDIDQETFKNMLNTRLCEISFFWNVDKTMPTSAAKHRAYPCYI